MLQIVQDYKNWKSANKALTAAKKAFRKYSDTECEIAIDDLAHCDPHLYEGLFGLLQDKFTCEMIQTNCGTDHARCAKCPNFIEFGDYTEMRAKLLHAKEKQKIARNKLIANFCFTKAK